MADDAPAFEAVQPRPDGLDSGVAYWLEMAEAHAYRDAVEAAASVDGNPAGVGWMDVGGAVAFSMKALDFSFFNRVIGLGVARPASAGDVGVIRSYYGGLGITKEAVHVANGAEPDALPRWLAGSGLVLGSRWVKMWHDLTDLPPMSGDRRIELIAPEDAAAYGDVVLTAFEMPEPTRSLSAATVGTTGWRHYLGYEADVPVAAGATRIEDGVAWLGYGATLQEHRGRGWQTAMFLRRLHDAREAGCRFAVTETGEETEKAPVNHSYRNMVRTGFRLGYARRNWYRP